MVIEKIKSVKRVWDKQRPITKRVIIDSLKEEIHLKTLVS